MVDNVEVLEWWELIVAQRSGNQELQLSRSSQQTIASVDAKLLTHALNHTIDLSLEVSRVIDDVKVRMTDPRGCRFVIQFASMINAFRAARVFLE